MFLIPVSPNFLNYASLQTSGHFRFLPHSTNMFSGALPRTLWHAPMPTPTLRSCLTPIQRTARGQHRWQGVYSHIVIVQLWCSPQEKKERCEQKIKRKRKLSPHNMALMVTHGLFSVERLLKASSGQKISILGRFDGNCDSP